MVCSQNILRTWRDVWGLANQCLLVLRALTSSPTALCQGRVTAAVAPQATFCCRQHDLWHRSFLRLPSSVRQAHALPGALVAGIRIRSKQPRPVVRRQRDVAGNRLHVLRRGARSGTGQFRSEAGAVTAPRLLSA